MILDILKNKVVWFVAALGLILLAIFQLGLYPKSNETPLPSEQLQTQSKDIAVVSTNPDPLENATVAPNQTIELTFNQPLENEGELKYDFEPVVKASVKLSDDHKTAKITPQTSFELGTSYTLFIRENTKFEGKKTLEHGKIFHFSAINYKGL